MISICAKSSFDVHEMFAQVSMHHFFQGFAGSEREVENEAINGIENPLKTEMLACRDFF